MRILVAPEDPFGLDNLPYGVYSGPDGVRRIATRVGETVVDLGRTLGESGADAVLGAPTLNAFMAQGRPRWIDVRARLREALERDLPDGAARPLSAVRMHLPIGVGDYVDFYASEHHAAALGRLFRPESVDPLTPNWKHLPIGYHGRSASIVVSGTEVVRPRGQYKGSGDPGPVFGPSTRLDIEAELAFVVGVGNPIGTSIAAEAAADHIFGVALFNDWSARDIQAWEYVPLGPNLGKSFASTMSAWITPLLALDAARITIPTQEPPVLPYLLLAEPWGLDIDLEVVCNGVVISRPPYDTTYWSPAQMLAHLTVNGAPTRTGDVFASGTISGPGDEERGSLIELTAGGARPVRVGDAERIFLEDGDEIALRASAPGPDGHRIALGEARGRIRPALQLWRGLC